MTTNTDALHELAGVVATNSIGDRVIMGDGFALAVSDPAVVYHLTDGATVSISIWTGAHDPDTDQ